MYVMSTYGRFHAPSAAEALARAGADVELHLRDLGARVGKPVHLNRGGIRGLGLATIPRFVRSPDVDRWAVERFDQQVAADLRRRTGADTVFHGFAACCRSSLREARREGIPSIVERSGAHALTERSLIAEEHARLGSPEPPRAYYRSGSALERMLEEYELAEKIVVSSSFCRATFIDRGIDPQKVEVVGLGGAFQSRPWTARPVDPFCVLSIGSQPELKGMFDLLKAWESARLEGARLLLRTPMPNAWRSRFDARTLDTTELLPQIPHHELGRYYGAASVFCLLSITDGFGLVVAEAMSFGCPVIVSKNVGASDLVTNGENGFIVDIRSPEQVAEKLRYLKDNPEALQEMSRRAVLTARRVTWERYASTLLALWSKIPNAVPLASRVDVSRQVASTRQ
jgi:glycosyltransferase involved in cell wall biosynthesis